jgi:hypothetical protein
MASIVDDLKAQARILHRLATARNPGALARLQSARVGEQPIQRRHCLTVLARELGFGGWPHAASVLGGDAVTDFGTLLYAPACVAQWNIWSASYEEARTIRLEHGGYLLAYKRQFLIVDAHFITTLGLDPQDRDWERIERDWVQPANAAARARLYEKLVRARRPTSHLSS